MPNGHKTIPNMDCPSGTSKHFTKLETHEAYVAGWRAGADQVIFGVEKHGLDEMVWFVQQVKEQQHAQR